MSAYVVASLICVFVTAVKSYCTSSTCLQRLSQYVTGGLLGSVRRGPKELVSAEGMLPHSSTSPKKGPPTENNSGLYLTPWEHTW